MNELCNSRNSCIYVNSVCNGTVEGFRVQRGHTQSPPTHTDADKERQMSLTGRPKKCMQVSAYEAALQLSAPRFDK